MHRLLSFASPYLTLGGRFTFESSLVMPNISHATASDPNDCEKKIKCGIHIFFHICFYSSAIKLTPEEPKCAMVAG